MAVVLGFLTQEQREEVLRIQKELERSGVRRRFGEVCLERRVLNRQQVFLVLRAQGKRILSCSPCKKSYNVHHFSAGEIYRCKHCGGTLSVPQRPLGLKVNESVLLTQTELRSTRHAPLPVSPDLARMFPDYEIQKQVGQGGMGTVFKAREKANGRWVALKVLAPFLSENDHYVKRFFREAKNLQKLDHPNIVGAYGAGEAGEYKFLLMEYVHGASLSRVIKKRGKLPERLALEIVRDVALGLDFAWQHRIIHRDVKPHNIMLGRDHAVKLCDLGLSKEVDSDISLSGTGSIRCSPAYASPEQLQGLGDCDCRTDTYSLGVTLYQMVVGELPFQATRMTDYLFKHLQETPPHPLAKNPALSQDTGKLILRMMEKSRERRPEPAEVSRALSRHLARS